jgi:hypothetical protein
VRRPRLLVVTLLVAGVLLAGCFPVDPAYRNPVYRGSFADPFVLRAEGGWFAYGTNIVDGGAR